MATAPSRTFTPGINIPAGTAKVKVGAGAVPVTHPNKVTCYVGEICAEGTATPPAAGVGLVSVHARIYRTGEAIPPVNEPPSPPGTQGANPKCIDPLSRVVKPIGTYNWHFSSIPNAHSEPAPNSSSDNVLAVWCVWEQDPNTFEPRPFNGVNDTKTDCEARASGNGK